MTTFQCTPIILHLFLLLQIRHLQLEEGRGGQWWWSTNTSGHVHNIWMAQCKRDVTPVHKHWSYISFALNHQHLSEWIVREQIAIYVTSAPMLLLPNSPQPSPQVIPKALGTIDAPAADQAIVCCPVWVALWQPSDTHPWQGSEGSPLG